MKFKSEGEQLCSTWANQNFVIALPSKTGDIKEAGSVARWATVCDSLRINSDEEILLHVVAQYDIRTIPKTL